MKKCKKNGNNEHQNTDIKLWYVAVVFRRSGSLISRCVSTAIRRCPKVKWQLSSWTLRTHIYHTQYKSEWQQRCFSRDIVHICSSIDSILQSLRSSDIICTQLLPHNTAVAPHITIQAICASDTTVDGREGCLSVVATFYRPLSARPGPVRWQPLMMASLSHIQTKFYVALQVMRRRCARPSTWWTDIYTDTTNTTIYVTI